MTRVLIFIYLEGATIFELYTGHKST